MKRILFCLCISTILISCSSDDDSQSSPLQSDFYALSVGNKWVYKYYTRDLNTGEYSVFANKIDSVEITGTDLFDDITYYAINTKTVQTENNILLPGLGIGEYENTVYKRDSLGYLISNEGNIYYWNNISEERFWHSSPDPDFDVFAKLNNETSNLNIESGNFECLNLEIYAKNINTNIQNQTASHIYYSDGIGRVCEKIGYVNGGGIIYERRLESFVIN